MLNGSANKLREDRGEQKQIYYISKTLTDPETCYTMTEIGCGGSDFGS